MTWRVEQRCNFSNKVTRTTLVSTRSLTTYFKTCKLLCDPQTTTAWADCNASGGNAGKHEAVRKDDDL